MCWNSLSNLCFLSTNINQIKSSLLLSRKLLRDQNVVMNFLSLSLFLSYFSLYLSLTLNLIPLGEDERDQRMRRKREEEEKRLKSVYLEFADRKYLFTSFHYSFFQFQNSRTLRLEMFGMKILSIHSFPSTVTFHTHCVRSTPYVQVRQLFQ